MRYIIKNHNFNTCQPEACNSNNWVGFDNGYKNVLPGRYTAYAVSYTNDGGKSFEELWYLTDGDVEVSNTTHGNNYSRVCRIWRVKFDGKNIRRIRKPLQNFVCERCGTEYQRHASYSQFCSKKCKN